jgi:peptidoglycan/xylan/chitin deacetylase (PgdA/CDA1 family)
MTSKQVADRAVARAHPGTIILLHDGLHEAQGRYREATIDALPEIIHRLRAMGYTFVTLPQLLQVPESLNGPLPPARRAEKM